MDKALDSVRPTGEDRKEISSVISYAWNSARNRYMCRDEVLVQLPRLSAPIGAPQKLFDFKNVVLYARDTR